VSPLHAQSQLFAAEIDKHLPGTFDFRLVTEIAMAVSLSALLFSGALAEGLPRAAGGFVFATGFLALFIGIRTRLVTAIGGSQDLSAILLLTTLPSVTVAEDPISTMLAVLVISSVAFGLTVIAVTRLRLTQVGRYLPSTVVMGFVAGTGCLLVIGGIEVMIDGPLQWSAFGDAWQLLLPGLLLAGLVAAASEIERLPAFVVGALVISAVGLFHAVVALTSDLDRAADDGWLVGPFGDLDGWRPVGFGDLGAADWGAVASAALPIAAAVFVSMVGLLLNLKGIQTTQSSHVDFDREMQAVGLANVLAAPIGGLMGYHKLGATTLATRVGARGPVIPTAIGLGCMVLAVTAGELIGYLPRFVVGGILTSLGTLLLIHWLVDLRRSWSTESIVSIAIVIVSVRFGMLEAVGVGILAASAIFLIRYSRVDPVRASRSAAELSSSVERTPNEVAYLQELGPSVRVFEVQGYLFFGSIEVLHDQVADVINEDHPACIIIDFRHVTGLDLSAATVLRRLADAAAEAEVRLLWSGLKPGLTHQLIGRKGTAETRATYHPDLDHALEEAENLLLASSGPVDGAGTLEISDELRRYLTPAFHRDGARIESLGDTARTLYLIETGRCVASLPRGPGSRLRLREFGAGSIFGEIGFRLGQPRTADIHAVGDVELLTIDRDAYEVMIAETPELAVELNELMLNINFHRVIDLTRRLNREMH
ncbi:MAG: SulP family inorganic anion transporter, partial [Actinomycetota bacterium]